MHNFKGKEEQTHGKRQDDLPAQEGTESQGTRFPQENGYQERTQRSEEKKTERKKEALRLIEGQLVSDGEDG